MTKVLITGGNGFVGSHLAEKLQKLGDEVVLFDKAFGENTRWIECGKVRGDITDAEAVRRAVDNCEAVFHLAAISRVAWGESDPKGCWDTNVAGSYNVLDACASAQSRPVLFIASSREVYGDAQYLPVDEKHPKNPKSIYGITKYCAEQACIAFRRSAKKHKNARQVIFRLSNVYGSERDLPERAIPRFMHSALKGEDIVLNGGDQILDFTHIDDTIDGMLRAYRAALGDGACLGEDFGIGTGRGYSLADLAKMIVSLTGSSSRIICAPSQPFDVKCFYTDCRKAEEALKFRARTTLEEGLRSLRDRIVTAGAVMQ